MKGIQAILFDMKNYWPSKYLLIFNTHLDPRKEENRKKQINEIFIFMNSIFQYIEQNYSINFENCGVLLMGDFNISSSSKEKKYLMEFLKVRDLYEEYINKNGISEEYTYDNNNSLFTFGESRRIDYIFSLDKNFINNKSFMKFQIISFDIIKQSTNLELSDHWPLIIQLLPNDGL